MEGFNNLEERLRYLIEKSGKSMRAFAIGADIDPSNVSKILSGNVGITAKVAKKIEDAYGYNSQWLMNGKGGMLVTSPIKEEDGAIPYYNDVRVSAGQSDLASDNSIELPSRYIVIPGLSSAAYAFPVIGCSMEPTIKAGDIIAVKDMDSWDRVDPDKIYMILTHDDRMIKHLAVDNEDKGSLWCLSDNENYPKFRIKKSDILKIWRVVFHGRLL